LDLPKVDQSVQSTAEFQKKVAIIRLKDYIYIALPETYILQKRANTTRVIALTTKGHVVKKYEPPFMK
jgi:hypothetical protein